MKLLLSVLLVAQGALAASLVEFGRLNGRQAKGEATFHNRNQLEKDALFQDEESQVFMEFERYLELSMSLSMSYSTGTGGGDNGGGGGTGDDGDGGSGNSPSAFTLSPTTSPDSTQSPSGTPIPSSPFPSGAPSSSPTSQPVGSPVTDAPATSPLAPALGLYECTDQGVVLATTPAVVTTPIALTVLYEAEGTVDTTDGFLSDLEQALFSIALDAALQCAGSARRDLNEATRKLITSSSVVGSCNVTEDDDNTCFTLETTMAFELNENIDPDYVAFLSYSELESAMENYASESIDTVVRLDYLAPTPTLPDEFSDPETQPAGRSYSALAIGAAAAMVAGGTLALYVWVHNRRTRNKRHVELQEENHSLSPVSFFSAERDPYEDA